MRLWILGLLVLSGCGGKATTPVAARPTTLADLEKASQSLDYLSYVGSDSHSHYFKLPTGVVYKVPLSAWDLPAALRTPPDGSRELFVTIKGGKVSAPASIGVRPPSSGNSPRPLRGSNP